MSMWAKTLRESDMRLVDQNFKKLSTMNKLSALGQKGEDGRGVKYRSVDQMWKIELDPEIAKDYKHPSGLKPIGTKQDWYTGSLQYWNEQPATVDGVLGGYGEVHDVDSVTSAKMLEDYRDQISGFESAVDLGAGIGRISKTTLLPRFKQVDLVEPAEIQIKKAEENVPEIRKFY